MALLDAMSRSDRGWFKSQMKDFLFFRYRGGVRDETLESIIQQLIDRSLIYGKPKPGTNIFLYYVNKERIELLRGALFIDIAENPKPKRQKTGVVKQ
jgi:hypothetical protein